MDDSVFHYRRFRLVGLARGWFCHRCVPVDNLWLAAFFQCHLDTAFFGLHRVDLGFLDIVLLWLSIVTTIALFYPIHLSAALILLPYLAWVTFAVALNFAIWRLNPSMASKN